MGDAPAHFDGCGADCPVERVTWHRAVVFCNQLSAAAGLPACYESWDETPYAERQAEIRMNPYWPEGLDCQGYRLPTEAEWEYAARAGTLTHVCSGDVVINWHECPLDPPLDRVGWYCGNSDGSPHPVGRKVPNAWGLFDMHGNVKEWCVDLWSWPASEPQVDPVRLEAPAGQSDRIVRGGSWGSIGWECRSAARFAERPDEGTRFVGLRPVRTLP